MTKTMAEKLKDKRYSYKRTWLCVATVLAFVFVFYTLLVKFVDVKTNDGMTVGCGTINFWWRDIVGVSSVWHLVSNVIAAITLLLMTLLLVWQLVILLRVKKVSKLPRHWWLLDLVLIILGLVYLIFEICVINYRPILINGVAEASYPSSHVLLFCTFLPLVILTVKREKKSWRFISVIGCVLLLCLGILARLLSGYHWLTDIVGGILLGVSLVVWYQAFLL